MKQAFTIVFQDEYLVVLNKMAKILVQPSPRRERHTLTSLLQDELKEEVFPCHRLDRETSGLIIYAKTRQIQSGLSRQFAAGLVEKAYLAFIKGGLNKPQGVLEGVIIDRQGQRFGERPKKAKTFYKVVRKMRDFSLVELKPQTGRTNQLRIQLAQIGCPILGEANYALRRDFPVKFRRLALHAYFLSFIHPVSKDRVDLKIDLAPDMKEFLKRGV